MERSSIKYNIDEIDVNKEIMIRGWVFSSVDPNISVFINGVKKAVEFKLRDDVANFYSDEKNAQMSGFTIYIPFTKKVEIVFSDSKNKEVKELNPLSIRKEKRKEKLKGFFRKKAIEVKDENVVKQQPTLFEKTKYSDAELQKQKNSKFTYEPLISIVVPLYNTPENFLIEMIESVKSQTYSNWELCLADGSDKSYDIVRNICQRYIEDNRIIYKELEKNYGISGNTNECLKLANGDYIGLFDHDDLLHPAALYEVVKVINESNADFIYTDEITFMDEIENVFNPHFKPDFAIDNLRANNYICHFTVFSKTLYEKTGDFRSDYDGSQDFDMVLRLTENANKIAHIPIILYYWRAHANSVASDVSAKPYVIESAHKAVEAHLNRSGIKGVVKDTVVPSMYKIEYEIIGEPLISIIIPNKDHIDDLEKCLISIKEKTTYLNYEIIIVENNSEEKETFKFYEKIENDNVKIAYFQGGFNYSAINNFGFEQAKGEYMLLLNNDVEIISNAWLEEMLMYCQRNDVGAVGAKLYYPDNTIQHAGLGLGLLTLAGHYHRNFPKEHPGYMGRLIYAQDVTGVTAACLMVKKSVYEEVHGLDETFEVAFNDVDFCMKIRQKGYLIVFTPFAELYHYESKSRGLDSSPEKRKRFEGEVERFLKKWDKEIKSGDPYYNENLSLDKEDFSISY